MKKRLNATVAAHNANFFHKLGDGNTSHGLDIVLDALVNVFDLIQLTDDDLLEVYQYVIKQRGSVSIMLYDMSMRKSVREKLKNISPHLLEIAVLKSVAVHG